MERVGSTAASPRQIDLLPVFLVALDDGLADELEQACALSTCCELAGRVRDFAELQPARELLAVVSAIGLSGSGFDGLVALRRRVPGLRLISIGDSLPPRTLAYAFRLGLRGCLSGAESVTELVRCLQVICGSGVWIPRDQVLAAMSEVMPTENPRSEQTWLRLPSLTDREGEVLAELLEGKPNKTIANELGISEQTVKLHLNRVYGKLGVTRRVELMKALSDSRGPVVTQRFRVV